MNKKKKPTMKDVARLAGVSQPTVSRFLNGEDNNFSVSEETKSRILRTIKKLGYVRNEAARELKGQKSNPRVMFCNVFESPLVYHNIRDRLQQMEGMSKVSFFFHNIQEDRLIHDPTYIFNLGLSAYRICILMGSSIQGDEWFIKNQSSLPVPFLFIGRHLKEFPSITIDYEMQTKAILEYLLERNCRRILYLGRQWTSQVDHARLLAYNKFCMKHSLESLILNHGSFDEHGGYMLTHEAMAQNMTPDSVICVSDAQAIGVVRALHDAGLSVSKQVRVIGYGDFPICRYTIPSITSVPQFTYEIVDAICGYIAGVILNDDSCAPAYQKIFATREIVRRESG